MYLSAPILKGSVQQAAGLGFAAKANANPDKPVLLTTMGKLPGYHIQPYAKPLITSSVIALNLKDYFKTGWISVTKGGQLKLFEVAIRRVGETALKQLGEQARLLGADAVMGIQPVAANMTSNAAEVLLIGTAVKLTPEPKAGNQNKP